MHNPDREAQVSRAFVALADTLVEGYDVIDLLDTLVACSVELLAADAAGILLGDAREQLRVVAASSEDASLMELLALETEDSPCVECYRTLSRVRAHDLDRARSWRPEFVAAVDRAGAFRSVHALPLRLRGVAVGVLSLFHNDPGPLSDDDLALGQALADVATLGVLSGRVIRHSEVVAEQLRTALDSRVVIEQAKGVIAERCGLGMNEAFALLRIYGRDQHQGLSELSRRILARDLDPVTITHSPTGVGRHRKS